MSKNNNYFWIPNTKWQLVDILAQKYPNDKKKFNRMNKKQLLAILYNSRKAFYHAE